MRLETRTRMRLCLMLVGLILSWPGSQAVTFPLTWSWSNPYPHGNNIIDIASNGQLWVQVAELGQMYSSTNWLLWTPVPTPTTNDLRAVTFFNNQIVVSGASGTILSGSSTSSLALINLGTTDWLEGVAASPKLVVVVGDNGAIYTSSDALNWQRQPQAFTDWLRSAAYGNPGGLDTFVAVGEAGFVATSHDGTHWQAQSSLTSADLNRVCWFSGQFWALGDSGVAFTSSAGTQWQAVSSGATNTLNAFAGIDSMRLLAGDSEVRFKSGRNAWSNELDPTKPYPPPTWTYLSASTTTNVPASTNNTDVSSAFLLCGRTGMMAEGLISTNSSTNAWFVPSNSVWNWLWDVKHFPNLYLAVGDIATILSSPDGLAWTPELPPDSATNSIFLGVGGNTNMAVAVGSAGTIITSANSFKSVVTTNADGSLSTNQVSTLGIFWQGVQPPLTTQDLQGVTVFGNTFVVSGGSGIILTSPDGAAWTAHSTPTSNFLSSLEAFPGGLVAVGKAGTILTSPTGSTWALHSLQTTNWIYRVRYLNGKLIAVGQNGMILTSADGVSWTFQNSGTAAWLNDVQYLSNTYFAVGNQGTVLTSPDALNWTPRGIITGKSIFGAANDGAMLVVVGIEGIILRSQIVPIDLTVRFVNFPSSPGQNSFLFSGYPGEQFTLDRSTNVPSWTTGPLLQIGTSGTLPYSDGQTNSPFRQFFRATPKM
jgi:hypothetical protein